MLEILGKKRLIVSLIVFLLCIIFIAFYLTTWSKDSVKNFDDNDHEVSLAIISNLGNDRLIEPGCKHGRRGSIHIKPDKFPEDNFISQSEFKFYLASSNPKYQAILLNIETDDEFELVEDSCELEIALLNTIPRAQNETNNLDSAEPEMSNSTLNPRSIWLMFNSEKHNIINNTMLRDLNSVVDNLLMIPTRKMDRNKVNCSDLVDYVNKTSQSTILNVLDEQLAWKPLLKSIKKATKLIIPLRSARISLKISDTPKTNKSNFIYNNGFVINYQFITDLTELNFTSIDLFWCRNRRFINLNLKCNDIDDCGDASDESLDVCKPPPLVLEPETPSTMKIINNKKLRYYDTSELHCCRPHKAWDRLLFDISKDMEGIIENHHGLLEIEPEVANEKLIDTQKMEQKICFATLIHPQYAVTTTKCLGNYPHELKLIKRTFVNRDVLQTRYADNIHIYPGIELAKWTAFSDTDKSENDLEFAILRLNAPLRLTFDVFPICLGKYGWKSNEQLLSVCYATDQSNGRRVKLESARSYNCQKTKTSSTDSQRIKYCLNITSQLGLGTPIYCRQSENSTDQEDKCNRFIGFVSFNGGSFLEVHQLTGISHWLASSIEMFEQYYTGN